MHEKHEERISQNAENQSDLKFQEAEKAIANKDVIIKMLQEQVKKLQENCKNNLNESENYRYKYCIASEQVKRLRACPKVCKAQESSPCRGQEIFILKHELNNWNSDLNQVPDKPPSCFALLEELLRENKQLLQRIIEIWEDKQNREDVVSANSEMQQERKENTNLQDQSDSTNTNTFVNLKDSLLETYRRSYYDLRFKTQRQGDSDLQETSENVHQVIFQGGGNWEKIFEKLDELINHVNSIAEQQGSVCNDLQLLKENHQQCDCDQHAGGLEKLEALRTAVLANQDDQNLYRDSLEKSNGRIEQELADLKQIVTSISQSRTQESIIKHEASKEVQTSLLAVPLTEKKHVEVQTEYEYSQCAPVALRQPNSNHEEELSKVESEDKPETHSKGCECDFEDYIEEIADENRKIKASITCVVSSLTQKLHEWRDQKCNSVYVQVDTCSCGSTITCPCPCPQDSQPCVIELEEIYQAVQRNYYNTGHKQCISAPYLQQHYSSEECLCDELVKVDGEATFRCNCSQSEGCRKTGPCQMQSLATNLETYVEYLNEQLNVISNIEREISSLRSRKIK